MIVKEDFLKKLRSAFDLNIYEVKIWTALLSKGMATAGELSDISNVPRSRSYDILESLEKKGFVIMKLGKPIKYLAVEPIEIINRVRKNIQASADTHIDLVENIKQDKIFQDLELLYKTGIDNVDVTALSGALKGRDNSYHHISSMIERAEKSVSIMTSTEGFLRKLEKFKKQFKKLSTKGIKIKVIAPVTKEAKLLADKHKGLIQLKNANSINARFVIVDDKEVMFMVTDDSSTHASYDTGIWVSTPYFAGALSSMFTQTWNSLKN
jgi:HTH-type transcriptional regulator, sugar sensing transcriptional regulator